MAKLTKEEERVIAHIKKVTAKWAKAEFSEKEDKLSDKAQELTKLFESSFTTMSKDDKTSLAKAFGYVIGEPIRVQTDDKLVLPRMCALVLTGAFDDHSYKLNEVIVHIGDGIAVKADGTEGNWIEPPRKWARPATEEEIDSIPAKQLKGLFEAVEIVA